MKLSNLFRTIFVLTILSGCITQKKCYEKFPPETHTMVHDSIVNVRDTVYVPYMDVSFDTVSPCPPQVAYKKTISKGGLTSTVTIDKGVITQVCKADSLQAIVNSQREYISKTKTILPKEISILDSWYYFFRAGFWICLSLLVAVIAGLIFVK